MTPNEAAAAAVLSNGKPPGKNVKAKKPTPKATPKGKQAKADPILDLRHRAQRWADLHANPKTRSKMDEQIAGLTNGDARLVVLEGQRLAAGLPPKHLTKGKEHAA